MSLPFRPTSLDPKKIYLLAETRILSRLTNLVSQQNTKSAPIGKTNVITTLKASHIFPRRPVYDKKTYQTSHNKNPRFYRTNLTKQPIFLTSGYKRH